MPCENHSDYIEAVGQDVKEEESKSIYEAEIKAVAMEEEDDGERYGSLKFMDPYLNKVLEMML